MPTDTTEKGLENLIEESLLANGWIKRTDAEYSKEYAIDEESLSSQISRISVNIGCLSRENVCLLNQSSL